MKKLLALLLCVLMIVSVCACGKKDSGSTDTAPTQAATEAVTEPATEAATEAEVTGEEWKENVGKIVLSDSGITVTGNGAYVDGNTVIITEGGDWEVTGTCTDGMIYVRTCTDEEEKDINDKVKLRLNGMSLTNPDGPAIYWDRRASPWRAARPTRSRTARATRRPLKNTLSTA